MYEKPRHGIHSQEEIRPMSRRHSSRRTAFVSLAVALGVLLAAPAFSFGNLVTDLVGQPSGSPTPPSGPPSSAPADDPTTQAGTPPDYVPPMHGTNPHGQGTAGTVDLGTAAANPLSADPAGGAPPDGEEVVVGRSRGEQNADGTYHGHVTAAALLGNELIGINTTEGNSAQGPLDPLQTQLLDQVCTGSGGQICLTLLTMNSSTTSSGSTNHFSAATASIGGASGINAGAVSSDGNISDDGTCQTANGDSNVADADLGGGALTAQALSSQSSSSACTDGTTSQSNSSSQQLADIQGNDVGCTDSPPNAPNQNLIPAAPLIDVVCAADDSNGSQTTAPYGTREAVTAFVASVIPGDSSLIKLTTAGSESAAVAPTTPPDCNSDPSLCPTPCGSGSCVTPCSSLHPKPARCLNGRRDRNDNTGNGTAASQAQSGNGTLPFTGANVLMLAMLGLGLTAGGIKLRQLRGGSRSA
jgi:hypothetical protein